jgi:hypothetical protein
MRDSDQCVGVVTGITDPQRCNRPRPRLFRTKTGGAGDWKLPDEIEAAAAAITATDSDLFAFGRFPEVVFEDALANARRRWDLALEFDQALRSFTVEYFQDHKILWPPTVKNPLASIVQNLKEAESAWLDAVWLWPDTVSQEDAADRLWPLNKKGAMIESAQKARFERAEIQQKFLDRGVPREIIRDLRVGPPQRIGRQKALRRFAKLMRRRSKIVNAPNLLRRAGIGQPHLHPELWIRYVVLLAKSKARSRGWREMAREELGKVIPEPSLGHEALERIGNVALVFKACFFWVKLNKKSPILRNLSEFSALGRASELASKALQETHHPALSTHTIQRIIQSSSYLEVVKRDFNEYQASKKEPAKCGQE